MGYFLLFITLCFCFNIKMLILQFTIFNACTHGHDLVLHILDTENIKLVFCAVKDTIMQNALKEYNLA